LREYDRTIVGCKVEPSLQLAGLCVAERVVEERTVLRLRSAARCAMQGGMRGERKRQTRNREQASRLPRRMDKRGRNEGMKVNERKKE